MNNSNDPILSRNSANLKYSKFYHHRKLSQETELKKKPFDNLDSFAKEAVPVPTKPKEVGKIRRNSAASINPAKSKENTGENAIDKWINQQLISKIRCSQIINQPDPARLSILKETNLPPKPPQRNTRSVSSNYEANYAALVKEYEKKKEKINHEIECLRKTQPIKVDKFYQTSNHPPTATNETPKFGSTHFSQSQKSIAKPGIKTPKNPKCLAFLNAIKQQIDLDAKLRALKHHIPKEDELQIRTLLKSKYSIQDNITVIESEEFDPFAERKQMKVETLASELASSHLAAEQNWSKNIKGSFDQASLNEIFSSLESNEKGTVSLKGFVREMGILLQNEKYLRNRDLFRIYCRIEPFRREAFVGALTRKQ